MTCPECDSSNTHVLDARPLGGGAEVRRRRRCKACQHRWTTYEREEEAGAVLLTAEEAESVKVSLRLALGILTASEAIKDGIMRKKHGQGRRE